MRRRDAQPPPLADGVVVDAQVSAQDVPVPVHKVPRRGDLSALVQPGGVIPLGDEADLHAVRFVRHGDAIPPRQLPDLGLLIAPNGKEEAAQPLSGQAGQHIRLVVGVRPPAEGGAMFRLSDAGIVPRGDELRPHFLRPPEQGGEFHRGVAPGAGQGRPPGQIVPLKRGHDLRLQLPPDVPGGEGDADALRHLCGGLPAP